MYTLSFDGTSSVCVAIVLKLIAVDVEADFVAELSVWVEIEFCVVLSNGAKFL